MIEVEAAQEKIRQALTQQKEVEIVPILKAAGRVCAEEVYAKVAVPHFPRAGMDGYAVIAAETQGASIETPICLHVIDSIFAGDVEQEWLDLQGTAVRIMTGALIPEPYDAVIKQEWTDYGKKNVEIYREIKAGQNYGIVGEDVQLNQKILSQYQLINSRTVGILAAQGIETIKVLAPMKVGILATGNELVSLGASLTPGKIYDSNLYTFASFIQSSGSKIIFKEHCSDSMEEIAHQIRERVAEVDLLITTGGVSVGEKDYVPRVIDNIGGETLFHFVNMKPGTPIMASTYQNKVILSLSGNPFAAVVNLHLFYWSTLAYFMNCAEFNLKKRNVQLRETLKVSNIRRFIRAYEEEGTVSLKSKLHYSSVFHNTLETNCLIDQPAKKELKKGDYVTVYYWKA
ncbi:molybdopterin molybdotransferase MoeA [Enterococcus termitis]|uniref:Molybdopterin molybdenumtransferase n=1 Tax=Enterococcus termitis TaxID=332950 RepID=A0A1E5GK73_9ENTE|nr:molybdopterin molybdotransferase MoeA [Enterococcus termitis]OEG13079.1 molybdopterin molybdenumtransferase MoeA [Enterococcus termitis]OJG99068.1 molybdenum cofactor synthesis domain-containing protein [Enterococcus termitis]